MDPGENIRKSFSVGMTVLHEIKQSSLESDRIWQSLLIEELKADDAIFLVHLMKIHAVDF